MRNRVVEILENNRGKEISGSDIAALLKVSRAAVWKVITKLREEGYMIEATSNRGYKLVEASDVFNEPSLTKCIQASLVKEVKLYKSVNSTNEIAKQLAIDGAEEGVLVLAEEQTAGKGRRGRTFYSPKGKGIYMSLVLRPKLNFEKTLYITMAAAVAVCKAIEVVTGVNAGIKWVNDIYCNNYKVAGILTEGAANIETSSMDYVILGIGINCSTQVFPDELQSIATALKDNGAKEFTRVNLISELLNCFEKEYNNIETAEFMKEYRERSIIFGKTVHIVGEENIEYTAESIDDTGRLLVKDSKGRIKKLNSGEISVKLT